jgi:glutamine cyclotransferase
LPYFCQMKRLYWISCCLLFFFFISCNNSDSTSDTSNSGPSKSSVPVTIPVIGNTLPHDTSFFTEGIEFYDSTILESTGNYGKSRLVQYDPKTGRVIKNLKLEDKYFGEGITVLHDTLYQLTYQEGVVFLYNVKDFKKIGERPFKGEGWGLTNDGKNLIASNGTSSLYYYEPGTFKLLKVVNVTENGANVANINELEYVDGFVYANQWQLNYIVKIDPSSGNVVSKLNFTDLIDSVRRDGHSEYFNGIAYNPKTKKFFVTGKLWAKTYEIQF